MTDQPTPRAVLGTERSGHRVLVSTVYPFSGRAQGYAKCLECDWTASTATTHHAEQLGFQHHRLHQK